MSRYVEDPVDDVSHGDDFWLNASQGGTVGAAGLVP